MRFVTGAHVGVNVDMGEVRAGHDAVILAAGATKPRDLPIPGREAQVGTLCDYPCGSLTLLGLQPLSRILFCSHAYTGP